MIRWALNFDVDFAGLLAPSLTSADGQIRTTKYQYLVGGPL